MDCHCFGIESAWGFPLKIPASGELSDKASEEGGCDACRWLSCREAEAAMPADGFQAGRRKREDVLLAFSWVGW